MNSKRPARCPNFGEFNEFEREIVREILFQRESKGKSFQQIANDLNAQARFPRHAPKWTWATIRYFYTRNRKELNDDHSKKVVR